MIGIMKKLLWAVMIEVEVLLWSVRRSVRRWLSPSSGDKPRDKFRFRTWLEVMQFEAKVVPSTFTWKAGAAGNWEVAANWINHNNDPDGYPKDADDFAKFDGSESNWSVTLNKPITIHGLAVVVGYNAQIKLEKALTIKGGTFQFNEAEIAPQNTEAHLILDGTDLGITKVFSGKLGSTDKKSQLQVINGTNLKIELSSNVNLGMDLVIGKLNDGTAKGTVSLFDTQQGSQGRKLVTKNDANITVHQDSKLFLDGDDGDGGIEDPDGLDSGHVLVNGGTVERRGSGEVKVDLPFQVEGGGKLLVADGTLTIDSNGTAATGQRSLSVTGGIVQLGSAVDKFPTLNVLQEIVVEGGLFEVKSTRADVKANSVEFKGSTTEIKMTRLDDTNFTDLYFILHGDNAKVKFTGGTWYFDVKADVQQSSDTVTVTGGNLEINNTGTTLDVLMLGDENGGETYYIFSAPDIVGDFATLVFHNAIFTRSIVPVIGGELYELLVGQPLPPPPPGEG